MEMERQQRNAAASGASRTTDKTETLQLGVRLQLTKVQSAAWLTEKQERMENYGGDGREATAAYASENEWGLWVLDGGRFERQ